MTLLFMHGLFFTSCYEIILANILLLLMLPLQSLMLPHLHAMLELLNLDLLYLLRGQGDEVHTQ